MSRSDRDRLLDVLDAIAAIHRHLEQGPLTDGLIFDAVRVRLIEIGEAVKDVPTDVLATQPHVPWRQVAAMRDQLADRYFDTSHSIVRHTVDTDLAERTIATQRLLSARPPVGKARTTRQVAPRLTDREIGVSLRSQPARHGEARRLGSRPVDRPGPGDGGSGSKTAPNPAAGTPTRPASCAR